MARVRELVVDTRLLGIGLDRFPALKAETPEEARELVERCIGVMLANMTAEQVQKHQNTMSHMIEACADFTFLDVNMDKVRQHAHAAAGDNADEVASSATTLAGMFVGKSGKPGSWPGWNKVRGQSPAVPTQA